MDDLAKVGKKNRALHHTKKFDEPMERRFINQQPRFGFMIQLSKMHDSSF